MDRKVGEEFFSGFYGTSYKVIESPNGKCNGCAFNNGINRCNGILEETGDCSLKFRSDGKSVIFKKVYKSNVDSKR